MAKESTFRNMVAALVLICAVCALVLGLVNSVTEEPIAKAEAEKVNSAIASVVPAFDNAPADEPIVIDDCEVYTATSGGAPVGYAVKVKTQGFGGAITMMVGFTPDGVIYNTDVISHSETPGLGAKISDPASLPRKGVAGADPAKTRLSVRKDGGEIDAITASTITSRAFLKGINMAIEVFQKIDKGATLNTEEDGQ